MTKKYFAYTFLLYTLTALVLFLLVNPYRLHGKRLDHLLGESNYPVLLLETKAGFDKVRLYRALTYYKILAEFYPQLSQADEMAGYCYFFLKNYRHSQQWLEKALKINPGRIWVKYNLGVDLYKQGEREKSLRCFKDIVEGDPTAQVAQAILSNLSTLTEEKRKQLFVMVPYFIYDVREKSFLKGGAYDGQLILHPWWHFFYPGQETLH